MFERLMSYLRQRIKTIKKPKRKQITEAFINFMLMKNIPDTDERKQLEIKKQELKKKGLQVEDTKTLRTKYLISKLDW